MADLITVKPDIMCGKAVISGTRITVEYVLEQLHHGHSIEAILDAHPRLTREGIEAAVQYAIGALRSEVAGEWGLRHEGAGTITRARCCGWRVG